MRHLRMFAAVVAALIVSGVAFAGEVRLKRVDVADAQGFDRPLPAFTILVPTDWRTEGGIVWAYNGAGCGLGMPYINWTATGPDGVSAVQIVPSESWGGMSYAANQNGCPQVMATSLSEFMPWYLKRYRQGIRNYAYTPRPEFAEELNKSASRVPTALGGEIATYAEAGEATFEWTWQGRTIRERVGLVAVFNVTRNPGGYAAVSVTVTGGVSLRAPEGGDPARFQTFANTFLPVPGYVALVQAFQERMQAIALKGVMDRAAIWRQAQAEISAIIAEVYANAQEAYDRVAAAHSRQIRDVDVYTDPATGSEIELPQGAAVWAMPDGTYIFSDDPNYDPAQAGEGDGGRKMKR